MLFHKVPVFKTSVSEFEEKFTKQIFAHRLQLSNGGENISLKENSDCLKLLEDESNFSNAGEFWAFLGLNSQRPHSREKLIKVFTFSIQLT